MIFRRYRNAFSHYLYIPQNSAPFINHSRGRAQFPPFKPFIVKPWSRPGDRSKDEIASEARHSWPDKADFRSVARAGSSCLHPHFFLFSASLRALPLISNRDPYPFSRVSRVNQREKRMAGTQYAADWPPRLSVARDCLLAHVKEQVFSKRKKQRGNMGEGVAFLLLRFIPWNASWARILARFIRNQCSVKNAVDINRVTGSDESVDFSK